MGRIIADILNCLSISDIIQITVKDIYIINKIKKKKKKSIKLIQVTREFANTLNYRMQPKVLLQRAATYNGKILNQNRNTWQHTTNR